MREKDQPSDKHNKDVWRFIDKDFGWGAGGGGSG